MFFSCPISPHWPRERQKPSGLPWSWESPKGPNLLLFSRSHQTISRSWVCHHVGSDAWVSHWDSHNRRGSNAWWKMERNGKPCWKMERCCHHRRLQTFKKPLLGTRFCISPCLGQPTRVSTFKQAKLALLAPCQEQQQLWWLITREEQTLLQSAAWPRPAPWMLSQQPKAPASPCPPRKCDFMQMPHGAWDCSTWPRSPLASELIWKGKRFFA